MVLPHKKQHIVRARGKDMRQPIGIGIAQIVNTNGSLYVQSSCVAATCNVLMSGPFPERERTELADIRKMQINIAEDVRSTGGQC